MNHKHQVFRCLARVRLVGRDYAVPHGTFGRVIRQGRDDTSEYTVYVCWKRACGATRHMKTWVPPYALETCLAPP